MASQLPAEETSSAKLPLSAPAKVLQSQGNQPEQPAQNAAVIQRQRPQPTLPGGKLPQYQLSRDRGVTVGAEEFRDGKLNFILSLPSQPVVVQATITIDGRPFPMARESRIEQILKAATQPAGESESFAGETSEAEDTEETDEADEADETAEADEEQPPAAQPTVPPYALAGTAAETVRRYIAATGRDASLEEIRWLLANRIDGPVLLMLNDHFQLFRANQRPVFHVLDRDRDGAVSADELERAVASFQECDLNRDDIIDYIEIAKAADDPRRASAEYAAAGKLIFPLPDAVSDEGASIPAPILSRFDTNGNGRLDPDEVQALQNAEPDLTLAVSFNTAEPEKSSIAVATVSAALQDAAGQATVNGETITLPVGGAWAAFSAVQAGGGDQISLGAVNDGYPLLPVVDPNDDGRFTVRELRELVDRLRRLDTDQDGGLSADEAPPTIRVCFGLGPVVHRELVDIRSVNPPSVAPAVAAPQWFVRMDRNKDNDLTRAEFPGTDEQFQALDADQDGLIGGQEAADFDSK